MAQQKKRVRINLSVTEEEAKKIAENAKATGYSTECKDGSASYAKALALGYTPKSVFDKSVVTEITKLHTDLGRVGGLIKKSIEDGLIGNEAWAHIGELLTTRREISSLIVAIGEGKFIK